MTTKSQKLKIIGYGLIILAILIGFVTRIIAVFQYITFDICSDPDQIRDAFTVINMWEGKLPTLGPSSSIGKHNLLPLYYYLFFPFTILGADPVFQAFPNALFSFLSILLLIYLVYQILEKVETSRRVLISGLAGFWYSIIFSVIFIDNFQWNPNSTTFFLLILTILYQKQIETRASWQFQSLLWISYGIIFAIIISLHSANLFIIPLVFLASILKFSFKKIKTRKSEYLLLPGLAIISATIALLPYWLGEFSRNFRNTKEIIKTILKSGSKSSLNEDHSGLIVGIIVKLKQLLLNYLHLGQYIYFFNNSWIYFLISIIFMSLITYLGIKLFRGNQNIWQYLCLVWGLFLLASSNLNQLYIHYQLLIVIAPIILTSVCLAYLNYDLMINKVLSGLIIICICLSIFNNFTYDFRFLEAKFSSHRLMNTRDLIEILKTIPDQSTICDPKITFKNKRIIYNEYNYINTYITRKNLKLAGSCNVNNFVIHPKRIMLINSNILVDSNYQDVSYMRNISLELWPIFKVIKNPDITRNNELFLETETAYVYRLK